MPDGSGTNNQAQNSPDTTSVSPPMYPAVPPPQPAQPIGTENVEIPPPPIVTEQNGDQAGQAPPMDIPPVVTMGDDGGGKKSKKAVKAIATVLSVILLLGAVGVGVYLVQQQQDIREKAACGGGCGNAPDPLPTFNKPPASVGPFNQAGKLLIYYAVNESGGGRKITIKHAGTDYILDLGNLGTNQRAEVQTNINVSAGDSITIVNIEELGLSSQDCAPVSGPPYYALGWMGVNPDNTCGTGLPGPPTACIPFAKVDVSSHISWAEGLGRPIVDKQCWADWREWPGDYDFNDFFIMFAVEPEAPPPPASCNNSCTQDADCETGLVCSSGSCRNSECTAETSCVCPAPPPDGALCQDVRAYNVVGEPEDSANWTRLNAAQLADLQSGEIVYISVSGWSSTPTLDNGGFDKAVFTVNGVDRPESTNAKPKSPSDPPDTWEIYDLYTIPDGVTSFTIRATIHHQTAGWF